MANKIEISHKTILFTLVVLGSIWLFLKIWDILLLVFVSFILMAALRPIVEWFTKFRIPRIVSILFIYLIVFGFIGVSIASSIPSLVVQSTTLVSELPSVVARLLPYWNIDVGSITQQIAPISENFVRVTIGIFSNLITLLTVLVVTFYLLLEHKHTESYLTAIAGEDVAKQGISFINSIEQRLGAWVRGELFLMAFIGFLVYLGLTFLGVNYALPLAIIAGLLEIVPVVGPIVSAVPAVLVALATSPILALSVAALYFIVQQVENNFVVPLVMQRSVGLSPLITIVSLMVGGKLAGIVGSILAVPIVLVIQVLVALVFNKSSKTK